MNENITETFEEKININNAENTPKNFKYIDERIKPHPSVEWKCRKCEFKETCKLLSSS